MVVEETVLILTNHSHQFLILHLIVYLIVIDSQNVTDENMQVKSGADAMANDIEKLQVGDCGHPDKDVDTPSALNDKLFEKDEVTSVNGQNAGECVFTLHKGF